MPRGVGQEQGPQHLVELSFPNQPLEDTVVPQGRARIEGAITAKPPGASDNTGWHFPERQGCARHFEYATSIITQERGDEIYFTDEAKRIGEIK